jgi:chloramphenicol-sensitive protein RarD
VGPERRALLSGVGAYGLWGALPLYWKLLHGIPALELLGHRILWSFLGLLAWMALSGRLRGLLGALTVRLALTYGLAALLVGSNWLLYVWAVGEGRVVEVSLGYFINPLVSVLLGVLLLGERLRALQWGSVGLATAGVAVLVAGGGQLPLVSLALAATFGAYGLVKKLAPLGSLDGLLLETALLAPPALLGLLWRGAGGALLHDPRTDLLLVGTGLVTAAPLLLFGVAARGVPLSVLGLLQYLAPSLQLLLGVAVFGEPFGTLRAAAFALVWLGLALFVADGLSAARGRAAAPGPPGAAPRSRAPAP